MNPTQSIAAEEALKQSLDAHSENFSDLLAQVEAGVFDMIRKSSASSAPRDAVEAWQAFSHAVDWTEAWIRGILAFHAVILMIVLIYRKNTTVQCIVFLLVCLLVRLAEPINNFCALHWTEFSTQNYFDASGVFIGIVYAAPLLLIAFMQLINFLVLTSSALIVAKRLEIKFKKERQRIREAKEAAAASASVSDTNTNASASVVDTKPNDANLAGSEDIDPVDSKINNNTVRQRKAKRL